MEEATFSSGWLMSREGEKDILHKLVRNVCGREDLKPNEKRKEAKADYANVHL